MKGSVSDSCDVWVILCIWEKCLLEAVNILYYSATANNLIPCVGNDILRCRFIYVHFFVKVRLHKLLSNTYWISICAECLSHRILNVFSASVLTLNCSFTSSVFHQRSVLFNNTNAFSPVTVCQALINDQAQDIQWQSVTIFSLVFIFYI